MYRIFGDGTYKNTKVFKNNSEMNYTKCDIVFNIAAPNGAADVDGEIGSIDYIFLDGIQHKLFSDDGLVIHTHFYCYDVELRGIQELRVAIIADEHTRFLIEGIFLPNLVPIENSENDKQLC